MAHAGEAAGAREGVVLDIGLGVGAVVVLAPPGLAGREVELSRAGDRDRRVHAVVHERSAGAATIHAAVFVDVAGGEVDLWMDGAAAARVRVRSGEVTTVDWRSAARGD